MPIKIPGFCQVFGWLHYAFVEENMSERPGQDFD